MRTKTQIVAVNQERAEQCHAQRVARRLQQREPDHANRYDPVRHVALDVMKLHYKPVAAPRTFNELQAVTGHAPGASEVPQSWEIVTDSIRG